MTREEEYYAAILGALDGNGDVTAPTPVWRSEEFLAAVLAAAKGETPNIPDPVWRDEAYLAMMATALKAGGPCYKLLAKKEFTVNTTSTTAIDVGTVDAGAAAYDSSKIIYVRTRDKAGVRDGYFTESDYWYTNPYQYKSQTSSLNTCGRLVTGKGSVAASTYGVYPLTISSDGTVSIKAKYNSSCGTIDGTYVVEVYALDWPDKVSPLVTVS